MNQKEIVVKLIVEAMRFRQYAAVLQKLGVDTCNLEPDLMDIIAKLLDNEHGRHVGRSVYF